jgi:hypothetical protein
MKALTRYVDQRGDLETCEDILDTVRKQPFAEEIQRLEKRKKGRIILRSALCVL